VLWNYRYRLKGRISVVVAFAPYRLEGLQNSFCAVYYAHTMLQQPKALYHTSRLEQAVRWPNVAELRTTVELCGLEDQLDNFRLLFVDVHQFTDPTTKGPIETIEILYQTDTYRNWNVISTDRTKLTQLDIVPSGRDIIRD
jgi:hypothetical protein